MCSIAREKQLLQILLFSRRFHRRNVVSGLHRIHRKGICLCFHLISDRREQATFLLVKLWSWLLRGTRISKLVLWLVLQQHFNLHDVSILYRMKHYLLVCREHGANMTHDSYHQHVLEAALVTRKILGVNWNFKSQCSCQWSLLTNCCLC